MMQVKTKRKLPSEWLEENVDSHSIYFHNPMAKRYKEEVGETAPWKSYTPDEVNGEGKHKAFWKEDSKPAQTVCCGYDMAIAINEAHGGEAHRQYSGRGFIFRACIEELKSKGR